MNSKIFRTTLLAAMLALGLGQAAAAPDFTYITVDGDTLIDIARQYMKHPDNWAGLQKLNQVEEPRHLLIGAAIRIPRAWLREDVVPARVGVVQGEARRGAQPLAVGGMVNPGEEISTGDNGFVTLELADGSRLVLQPKSRLRVDDLQRTRGVGIYRTRLNLLTGRVDNEVAKQPEANTGYQVRTPAALIAVRGTGFRVAAASEVSRAEVTHGVIEAGKGSGKSVPVEEGQGLVVDPVKPLGAPVPLLPAPQLAGVPALWERIVLRLPIPAVDGAVAYRAQLSRDEAFTQVVSEGLFKTNEIKLAEVPDGKYWLRVRGIAADGLEGRDALQALSVKARPEPPFLSQPRAGGKVYGEKVEFTWSAAQGVANYVLRLQREGSAQAQDSGLIQGAQFQVTDKLPPGNYDWRVASVLANGDRGPFGDPVRFSLRPTPSTPQPPTLDEDFVHFTWSGEPGQRFELEVARDVGFTDILSSRQVTEPKVSLPRPNSGAYFMRVRATDSDGFVGPWTAAQGFEVPVPHPLWLLLAPVLL